MGGLLGDTNLRRFRFRACRFRTARPVGRGEFCERTGEGMTAAARASHMLRVALRWDSHAASAASCRSERDCRSVCGALSGWSTGKTAGALFRMMLSTCSAGSTPCQGTQAGAGGGAEEGRQLGASYRLTRGMGTVRQEQTYPAAPATARHRSVSSTWAPLAGPCGREKQREQSSSWSSPPLAASQAAESET